VRQLFNEDWNMSFIGADDDYVRGPAQLVLSPSGDIIIADLSNSRFVQMSGIDDPNVGTPGTSTNFIDVQGVAVLPSGKLVRVHGMVLFVDLKIMDDIDETNMADFTGSSINAGSGVNDLLVPTRALVDAVGGYVYISDTDQPLGTETNRIARFQLDGSNRTNYGSLGTATGEFANPLLLAILPDRRIYIMDVGNDRLVRVDNFEDAATSWVEYKPVGADTFSFDYWYNFS
jgi:DNA-binding beta-propeller fold protein YncE